MDCKYQRRPIFCNRNKINMKSNEQDAKRNLFQWQQKELLLKIIGLKIIGLNFNK